MFAVPPPLGPVEPGPGCGPPGSALGFAEPSGPDPAALYPGPGLPPGAPSLQESEHLFQDVRSQDPGGCARHRHERRGAGVRTGAGVGRGGSCSQTWLAGETDFFELETSDIT